MKLIYMIEENLLYCHRIFYVMGIRMLRIFKGLSRRITMNEGCFRIIRMSILFKMNLMFCRAIDYFFMDFNYRFYS